MPRGVTSLRLFVAAYPPAELARAWRQRVAALDLPDHRLTPEDQVHLTVHFVGDIEPRDLDATAESAARAASGIRAFELTVLRLIRLPERGHARLIAVETDAPPHLLELQSRLARRMARAARRRPSDRFLPHFTVCRFRRPTPLEALDAELASDRFAVTHVHLMKSVLRPQGAQHTTLAEIPLEVGGHPAPGPRACA